MKYATVMIKPASSLCNLRCRYCFYADIADLREVRSFGVMQPETTEKMLENILASLEPGNQITFAFQGGEPTVAGLDYFRHFSSIVDGWPKEIKVNYVLQTNATLLDDDWCEYLRRYRYLVGVSLDLLPELHDSARLDAAGKGTYKTVTAAMRLLEKHRVEYNVLCTLTNLVARHPAAVWKQLKALDVRYVQFTPCLADLESDESTGPAEKNIYALTPERYASFHRAIFQLWLADYKAGSYRSVKLFDDVIGYLATGIPSTCDVQGNCSPQLVVEADGSVYPCDFYCIDRYQLGSITEKTLDELRSSDAMFAFLMRPHTRPGLCENCRYGKFCGGGCKRMQREVCCDTDGSFCGYRAFLDACMRDMTEIAKEERKYRR